ncbi:MAG TPA: nuclear transport factor 2 family protein [Chitinophaga sp.]|uniref:nuclear transport factor 2 family protein n=1 Tax=Chitinophaga sp. TaxID=1869181 RepID=UPI002C94064D|nr:nuclear transport factor 2 family protein [Chitinophaga sp.]HVI43527.1 nuclear transport factor 2 family protein [Chitinophaga sp.]
MKAILLLLLLSNLPQLMMQPPRENRVRADSDRGQLSALNARFVRDYMTNDVPSHDQLIHPDFVYISPSGKRIGREEYLKAWAHGWDQEQDKSFEYTNEVIRIFGNMALITCNAMHTRRDNDNIISDKTVYTDTYVKENGRWRCVQAQITQVR